MTSSPAHAFPSHVQREKSAPSLTLGGNLARHIQILPGHFLSQPFEQFLAHGTNSNEPAVILPAAGSRRARRQNRRAVPAESRSFPFPHIDDVVHVVKTRARLRCSAFPQIICEAA